MELPEELSNLISAGEVVERPLSVVKELVENSIDADASSIKIELIDSGLKKISVIDNGYGMKKDEIPLALKRHATSKIKNADDLFHISSLGFRGEALPSIASVSDFTISSSTNGLDGYQYSYKAGNLIHSSPTALPKGTKIEVENLFYNTPARYKHLGSVYQELSQITSYINRLVIAHPHVAILLLNNGKVILQTDGKSNIEMIISETYGKEVAKNMIYFENANQLYDIKGYTTSNAIYRSNRNGINLIVNGRIIKNQTLVYAILDAYKTILPVGKYPISVVEIVCDAGLIDVNVHPSKLEIRFTDEYALRALITKTIYDTIAKKEFIIDQLAIQDLLKQKSSPTFTDEEIEVEPHLQEKEELASQKEVSNESLWDMFDTYQKPESNTQESEFQIIDTKTTEGLLEDGKQLPNYHTDTLIKDKEQTFFQSLVYIGQYLKTYLLMEQNETLYLIDQHAAMERCMYEKISNQLQEEKNENYELLVPIQLEYSVSEIPLILLQKLALYNMGIQMEEFGTTTIMIRTLPLWVPKGLEIEFLRDIIQHLVQNKQVGKGKMYDSLAKTLSCKKSIKANMGITELEVKSLMENLDQCQMPYTCPHGRPTIIKFTKYEVEKMFKRVV